MKWTPHHAKSALTLWVGLAALAIGCGRSRGEEPTGLSKSIIAERKAEISKRVAGDVDRLITLYKHLHSNPELSLQEEKSAARLAQELKDLGFDVTPKIGGHGVVGVLKNGDGPTVLVRTDMDALPVVENTGLPYASKVRAVDRTRSDVGVMHACGHDMHMTCWCGTAKVLTEMEERRVGEENGSDKV